MPERDRVKYWPLDAVLFGLTGLALLESANLFRTWRHTLLVTEQPVSKPGEW